MTELAPGDVFGGYRISSVIGRGGMGVVYLAEHARLGRRVALKVLAPGFTTDPGFRARFERESRIAASLDHPNVVPIYEADEIDGTLFIAMRYVAGPDLRELLATSGRFEPRRALGIVAQIGSALDAAHSRGLIHRDVKPGNVLVAQGFGPDGGEHVYLTDFGLTKQADSKSQLTRLGTFLGTYDYAAPEQFATANVTPAVDIYALGCVLYECLTGQTPFDAESDMQLMFMKLRDEPPPRPTTVVADLPAGMDDVVARAIAKLPGDRYATGAALSSAGRAALVADAPPTIVSAPPTVAATVLTAPTVPGQPTPPFQQEPPPPTQGGTAGPPPIPPADPPDRPGGSPDFGRPLLIGSAVLVGAILLGAGWFAFVSAQPRASVSPSTAGSFADLPSTLALPSEVASASAALSPSASLESDSPPRSRQSEPVTPEPITPEPITPEPITPEPITPEPITPEPITPEPITPEPITPEPVALDAGLPPTVGSTKLEQGFVPDPASTAATSGGPVDVGLLDLGTDCEGYTGIAAHYELEYTGGGGGLLRFYFVPDAGGDTTLIVNDPVGNWSCGDDEYGLDPAVDFEPADTGVYDIWIGSFDEGLSINGTLNVTELVDNHP